MEDDRLKKQKERGKHFYSVMQERRRKPITLITPDGDEISFKSRQLAGEYLSCKSERTLEHCTLMLRKRGEFFGYKVKED